VQPLADEGLGILPMVVGCQSVVAPEVVIDAQIEGCHHLQGEVPAGRSNPEGALAICEAALIVSHRLATSNHTGADPAQPALIVEGRGQGLSLTHVVDYRPQFSKGDERIADIEPQIDGQLKRLTMLWEMLYGGQGLLKVCDGLPVGR